MKKTKRGVAAKAILQRLEIGPAFPRKISEDLKVPESTVKYNLRNIFLKLNLVKQLEDGKYALDSWNPEDLKIKNSYDHLNKMLFRQPTPDEIATNIQETPSFSRELLFKYISGYYEPTEDEIRISLKRIWYTVLLGLELEFPTEEEKNVNKIKKIIIKGLNSYITVEMQEWIRQDNLLLSLEKSKEYLKEFPEINPKIQRYFKENNLYITLKWSDYATHLLHSLPEFGGSMEMQPGNNPDEYIGAGFKGLIYTK